MHAFVCQTLAAPFERLTGAVLAPSHDRRPPILSAWYLGLAVMSCWRPQPVSRVVVVIGCGTPSRSSRPRPPCQVGAFGDPGRDPRGWTVTVAYAALVPTTNLGVKAAVRLLGSDGGRDGRKEGGSPAAYRAADVWLTSCVRQVAQRARSLHAQLQRSPLPHSMGGVPGVLLCVLSTEPLWCVRREGRCCMTRQLTAGRTEWAEKCI